MMSEVSEIWLSFDVMADWVVEGCDKAEMADCLVGVWNIKFLGIFSRERVTYKVVLAWHVPPSVIIQNRIMSRGHSAFK